MRKAPSILPGDGEPALSHPPAPALGPQLLALWEEPFQLSFWLGNALWERVVQTQDKIIQNTHEIYESVVCFLRRQKRAQAKVCFSEIVKNCGSVLLKHV